MSYGRRTTALALDTASTVNDKTIGARIVARTVAADAGAFAGLGADLLDFVVGILDGGIFLESAAFVVASLAAGLRTGDVSTDDYLDALSSGIDANGESVDADTERAHRVIALAGMAA